MNQYKVSELTNQIKEILEKSFSGLIMVHGEVTEYSKASSGHIYFSLKDDGGKLKSVYFKQYMRSGAFIPKNGDKVNAVGELKVYAPDGSYQLMVRKIVYSEEGDFWKKFEETKKRLAAEGLFDTFTKKSIPLYPKRIALLTASGGAAVKDFLITAKNYGNFFNIDLWPIPVQGTAETAKIIANTIKKAGSKPDLYHTLILTRGGGSPEDLAVFNEEIIARALKESLVPTISAIGHEQDYTISDYAADERVATPTAAAVRLSKTYKESQSKLQALFAKIVSAMQWRIESTELTYDKVYSAFLMFNPQKKLQTYTDKIDILTHNMKNNLKMYTANRQVKLNKISGIILSKHPLKVIEEKNNKLNNFPVNSYNAIRMELMKKTAYVQKQEQRIQSLQLPNKITSNIQKIDKLTEKMQSSIKQILAQQSHKNDMLYQRMELTNPERLLTQGYAIVKKLDGTIVSTLKDISLEEDLEIKIKDGYINTFVTGKKTEK